MTDEERRRRADLETDEHLEAHLPEEDEDEGEEAELEENVGRFHGLLHDRRKLASGVALFLLLVVGIYVVFPKLIGFDDSLARLDDATWYWVVVAIGFNLFQFAAYVALFRGILGGTARGSDEVRERLDLRASYQITMAGLAATRIFSAAGAGGIAVTYWALRKAGMPRRRSACRMVAFLATMYSVYLFALILFGVLLRSGVLPGDAPFGGTVVPAGIAAGVLAVLLLIALIPEDLERRLERVADRPGVRKFTSWIAKGPATVASGIRTAIAYIRHPRRGALAVGGSLGFWAANIGVLWASFEAFGGNVPIAVLIQGFFVGMAANLVPSPAGGVGSVDAGMIAAFLLFGMPKEIVFPAVLMYRVIAFWLPIPPGVVAYFQLRRTVSGWEQERARKRAQPFYTSESKVTAAEAR